MQPWSNQPEAQIHKFEQDIDLGELKIQADHKEVYDEKPVESSACIRTQTSSKYSEPFSNDGG
ncbi:hypothetical protein A2976_00685 [candidate division WWE3 bacterium RIFCSPLOWO2_01_FULL_41_9]|uniref:Uncharacterized protein n=1 Tax=candidate division WWE3 bacterium RIFCSPLOWO2_01_FULL_41_9 TaxID=1802626 RepID=A0A1F4VI11_UNCKA|nr:MAG: hypothetical protein A2976_00685 [candidate division WWE3 bacterium RIFCSPLOWO2_01_FULL_41_9]